MTGGYRGDLHVHPLMDEALFLFSGRPGDGRPLARRAGSILRNQVSFEGWRRVRMGVVVTAAYSQVATRRHLAEQVRQLEALRAWAREHEDAVEVALDPEAIPRIAASGRTALVPAVEGGHGIRSADDVDVLFRAGARLVTIVHFVDNRLGTAAAGQLLMSPAGWRRRAHSGLSPLGGEVVARMRRLGMMVDLSHASDRTALDALTMHDAPVAFTHTGARALHDAERNLSDELAQRAAERGGVIGLTIWTRLLRTPERRIDFAAHLRHLHDVAGPAALAFGTDLNGLVWRPPGIATVADLANLEPAVAAAGLPADLLDRTGPNVARAFAGSWALRDSAAPR